MWFEQLTGFKEESPKNVRSKILVEGYSMTSKVNNKMFGCGQLEISTLAQLRKKSPIIEDFDSEIQLAEVVADVQDLHCDVENENALFQVASQFNLLEMVDPHVIPEQGIDRYEHDYTQGPACSIACGAGTIFRNYFVKIDDQVGQSAQKQIDCLDLIGKELGNEKQEFWKMQNGYALMKEDGLIAINKKLAQLNEISKEKLKDSLKTGIQWNTEVTLSSNGHSVSQIFCSALPVAYGMAQSIYWEPFARLILEATYDSTLYAGLQNLTKNNSNLVYLTLVGGGAFGNKENWILESLLKSIKKFTKTPLKVKVVSFGESNDKLRSAIQNI